MSRYTHWKVTHNLEQEADKNQIIKLTMAGDGSFNFSDANKLEGPNNYSICPEDPSLTFGLTNCYDSSTNQERGRKH